MHEWALAEGIISTAQRLAEEEDLEEITEVNVAIGELQQVEHDIIEFALDQLRMELMKKTEFNLKSIPAKFRCRRCGEEWSFSSKGMNEEVSEAIHFVPEMAHVYIKCPGCGSPDFEVLEGRGMWLESIKGVKRDE
ncbi:MAG: hydrogenase nickel incorporation protein HypA [Candidatus Bathyarchaeia archaeon]